MWNTISGIVVGNCFEKDVKEMKEGMMEVDIREYIKLETLVRGYDFLKRAIREDTFSSIDSIKEYLDSVDEIEGRINADS